jgi:hypothetical protein
MLPAQPEAATRLNDTQTLLFPSVSSCFRSNTHKTDTKKPGAHLFNMKRRKKHADQVVAATAGVDNWKTWAGRIHGTDEFETFDLFRGMKRSFHNRFLAAPPPPGTACPVCFCEADAWYLTSCAHAVCLQCFEAYASSQVRDKEQSGPLKCPVCPRVLRKSDAIAALANHKELLKAWDLKIRNQLLRALPAYRSCPRCSDDSTNESTGGGFVTPSCLSPQHQERRDEALYRIRQGFFLASSSCILIFSGMARYIAVNPSRSTTVDIFFMLAPLYIFFGRASGIFRAMERKIAARARDALFKPISVECPCCSFEFILPASGTIQDAETKTWMENNTRPCPSCSVPITKDGGCNHIQCSHCNAKFCWACMRLRTSCRSYLCINGGINASPTREQDQPSNDSILERIDRILDREPPQLRPQDGMAFLLALYFRDTEEVQKVVGWSMTVFSFVFTSGFFSLCVLMFTLKAMVTSMSQRRHRQQNRNERPTRDLFLDGREEAMVIEAIERSLREQ